MAKDPNMKKVGELARFLSEAFDRELFENLLKKYGLEDQIPYIDHYMDSGWITPLKSNNRLQFHRGHMLIILRLSGCTTIHYLPGLNVHHDFEDIMLRRSCLCDVEAQNVRDDAAHIHQLLNWINSDSFDLLVPLSLSHTKAVIDIALDKLDPEGIYENLNLKEPSGVCKLVKDLLKMQAEISNVVALAGNNGISTPSTQYIFDRKRKLDELHEALEPLKSQYLAVPSREIMANERLEFMKQRNKLFIQQDYKGLIEYYERNRHLFDCEAKPHGDLCVCLGYIYGNLLNDNAKAADLFKEAFDYDPSNQTAFCEISRSLRKAEKWQELVEYMSNTWDTIQDAAQRNALILECAQIQAFKLENYIESIGLFERCMQEGYPGNVFDDLYKIIAGLMTSCTKLDRLRALVILTTHVVNYSQCDKIVALQQECDSSHEPLGRYMSSLIDAGIQSFKGDQPMALEILRDALALAPSCTLMDGLLLRIASKIQSLGEFKEVIDELSFKSLPSKDLSNLWLRITKVLTKVPKLKPLCFDYAERAVSADSSNIEAIDLCIALATEFDKKDRIYTYTSLKCAQVKDPKAKAELENTCTDLKLALEDNDELRMAAIESQLQFSEINDNVFDDLKSILSSVDAKSAIDLLLRVESRCKEAKYAKHLESLFEIVLERDLSDDLKKGLLEKYLECLREQGSELNIDTFIPVHAQLYALAPSEMLLNMLKSTAADNQSAMRTWAANLEDAINNIEDKVRVQKIYIALADCYQNILKDHEKAADSFANLLKAAPDSVSVFKCAFSAFERLERYYECTDIFQAFPHDKMSPQERVSFAMKCLSFALIHLYDGKAMGKFLNIIVSTDTKLGPAVIEQLLEKANAANVDKDQLICFLEQLENENKDITALALRAARVKLLAELERMDAAAALLDNTTYHNAKAFRLIDHLKNAAKTFADKQDEYPTVYNLWFADNPVAAAAPKANNPTTSIDALVKEYTENIDDDSFAMVIEGALKTLSAEEATTLCLKLGEINEAKERLTEAEDYFKKAFGYTVNGELAEFYKRRRKFKNAIKILTLLCDKATDETKKNAIRMDIAKTHELRNDYVSAAKVLDDVIAHRIGLDKATLVSVYRQKANYHITSGNPQEAIAALKQASFESDIKAREEIDVDTCLLMREVAPADAKRLHQSLMLRNAKSEKMVYLSLCFDIDNEKYTEADKRIEELLKSSNPLIKGLAYEQKLRMHQKRGDDANDIKQTAAKLLEIIPNHAEALKLA